MEYYEWLFFNSDKPAISKWGEVNEIDLGTQSIPDFFRLCLLLVKKEETKECFVKNMWKKGKKRLAIGQNVQCKGIRYETEHIITFLEKDHFVDDQGEKIPYTNITRVLTIPERPKFSKNNIKVGMKVRLVNKRYTGNVYTIINTSRLGFDAQNGEYIFLNLDYGSIDKIL